MDHMMLWKIVSCLVCAVLIIFDLKYIFTKKSKEEIEENEIERAATQVLSGGLKATAIIIVLAVLSVALSIVISLFMQSGIGKHLCIAWAIIQLINAFISIWCTFDQSKAINYKKEKIITSIIYVLDIIIMSRIALILVF